MDFGSIGSALQVHPQVRKARSSEPFNRAGTRVGVPGFFMVSRYQGSPLRGQPFALGFIPVGELESFAGHRPGNARRKKYEP
jgi:hypothetical protein